MPVSAWILRVTLFMKSGLAAQRQRKVGKNFMIIPLSLAIEIHIIQCFLVETGKKKISMNILYKIISIVNRFCVCINRFFASCMGKIFALRFEKDEKLQK